MSESLEYCFIFFDFFFLLSIIHAAIITRNYYNCRNKKRNSDPRLWVFWIDYGCRNPTNCYFHCRNIATHVSTITSKKRQFISTMKTLIRRIHQVWRIEWCKPFTGSSVGQNFAAPLTCRVIGIFVSC
jgi:hypothetical protein